MKEQRFWRAAAQRARARRSLYLRFDFRRYILSGFWILRHLANSWWLTSHTQTVVPVWVWEADLPNRYHVGLVCSLDRSSPKPYPWLRQFVNKVWLGGVRSSHLAILYLLPAECSCMLHTPGIKLWGLIKLGVLSLYWIFTRVPGTRVFLKTRVSSIF